MPDINLLNDTSRTEQKKKKVKEEKPFFALTHPPAEEKPSGEAKAPSSFTLFFKSLFSRKLKIDKEPGIIEERIVKRAPPSAPPPVTPYHKNDNVEDIFEKFPKEEEPDFESIPTTISTPPPASTPTPIFTSAPTPIPKITPPLPPVSLKKEKAEKSAQGGSGREEKSRDHSFLVNLLPEELVGREAPRKKIINLSLIVLGAVLLVALSYFGLFFYQRNLVDKTENAKKERLAVDEQIKGREEEQKQSIEFKKRLDSMRSLLATHIYWTKFFEKLEKYTLPDVYYAGGFNASTSGTLALQGMAPDFETVSRQLVVLKNAPDFVQNVSITSAQRETASVSAALPEGAVLGSHVTFGVSLNLAPDIFYKKEGEIESSSETNININNNTNNSANAKASVNENVNAGLNLNASQNQDENINSNILPSL